MRLIKNCNHHVTFWCSAVSEALGVPKNNFFTFAETRVAEKFCEKCKLRLYHILHKDGCQGFSLPFKLSWKGE